MGTRTSQHRRKVETHFNLINVVCGVCSGIFFNKESETEKGKGNVCPSCMAAAKTGLVTSSQISKTIKKNDPRTPRETFSRSIKEIGNPVGVSDGLWDAISEGHSTTSLAYTFSDSSIRGSRLRKAYRKLIEERGGESDPSVREAISSGELAREANSLVNEHREERKAERRRELVNRNEARKRDGFARRGDEFRGTRAASQYPAPQTGGGGTEDKEKVFSKLTYTAKYMNYNVCEDDRLNAVGIVMVKILEEENSGRFYPFAYWAKELFYEINRVKFQHIGFVSIDDAGAYGDGREKSLSLFMPVVQARQMDRVAALEALSLCKHLPEKHREIMMLLIDGATPMEISNETRKPITMVINLIKEARKWLDDGGSYLGDTKDRI